MYLDYLLIAIFHSFDRCKSEQKDGLVDSESIQNLIEPSPESAATALEGQTIPDDFALEVPDPSMEAAYPIVGLTWLLLYDNYDDTAKAAALENFVNWALSEGDEYAKELGYVPLTREVAQKVQFTVHQELATR